MPGFSKMIPFLAQLFPASGAGEVPQPREVTDLVHLTHPIWKPRFAHGCRLRREILTAAGTGANIGLVHQEPASGYFQMVVGWSAWQNSNTNVNIEWGYVRTANPEDSWGMWDDLTRSLVTDVLPAVATGWSTRTAPLWFPLPRGLAFKLSFVPSPPAVSEVRSHLWWVDVPGEMLELEYFAQRQNRNT